MKKSKLKQQLEDFNSALSAMAAKVKVLEEIYGGKSNSVETYPKQKNVENKPTIKNDDRIYCVDEIPINIPKENLEIGKWYKYELANALVNILACYSGSFNGYGFVNNKWCLKGIQITDIKNWKPATYQEVEEALINEAKIRGFKIGTKIKYENYIANIIDDLYFSKESNCVGAMTDTQTRGNEYFPIMIGGKWAEIVEETKEIDWSVPGQLVQSIHEDCKDIILQTTGLQKEYDTFCGFVTKENHLYRKGDVSDDWLCKDFKAYEPI